ncbi:MAG: tetratricopeptide repeat protein [Bacteroidota bacterium]
MKLLIHITLYVSALLLFSCNGETPVTDNPEQPEVVQPGDGILGSTPALQAITNKIKNDDQNAQLYFERAELLYEYDHYAFAIADLNKAIELDPEPYEYYHLLADAYLDNLESESALKIMESVVRRDTTRIASMLKYSEFQMILKQYDASMGTVSKILSLDRTNPDAFYLLGMNYKERGDTARAINSFQNAVDEDPYYIDAYRNLANLLDNMGSPLAVQYFDNVLQIDSTDMDGLFGKGWFHHQRDNLEEAKIWYEKAAALYPHNPDIHFNNGYLHMELKDIETALKKFDLSVKVEPTYAKGYYYRGLMAEMLGQTENAINDFEQALALVPGYDKAREGLERLGQNPN